jgi:serine/threonine protein kinase
VYVPVDVYSPQDWGVARGAHSVHPRPVKEDTAFVIVMEAADVTLDPVTQQPRTLSLADVAAGDIVNARVISRRVVECVDRLHQLGYVHCDLKPQHFLQFGGVWKLIDFGAARRAFSHDKPTYTPEYVSPELKEAFRYAGVCVVGSRASGCV